jgi:hypothetical protein
MSKVFRSSADSRHSWAVPLGAFVVVRESVTLAHPTGFRTRGEFGFKLSLWCFAFLNCTKSTKYEALEKNAISR